MDPYQPEECGQFYEIIEQFKTSPPSDLQFHQPPIGFGAPYIRSQKFLSPNDGLFALKATTDDGRRVIRAQQLGASIIEKALNINPELVAEVCDLLSEIEVWKDKAWNRLRDESQKSTPARGTNFY